ncbi:hypothetical protein Tco_1568276 [Tanacetum coccineum]
MMIVDIEESRHGPSDVMHIPSQPFNFSQKKLVLFVTDIHTLSIDISLRDVDIEQRRLILQILALVRGLNAYLSDFEKFEVVILRGVDKTRSELLNSELLNSELLNSELLNSELLNSELLNSELLNSELLNGELPNTEILMVSAENNTSGPVPQCLVLHQMTSDHNRSELGIQDHSNEQSSSKLVPKVVP